MQTEKKTTDKTMNAKIDALKHFTADICAIPYTEITQLCDMMLAMPNQNEQMIPGGRSGLNADGTPIQFCMSSRKDKWAGRLITDPASIYKSVEQRFTKSLKAIEELFEARGSQELKPLFDDMVNFHLPENKSVDEYPDGLFWIGAPVDSDGIAIYMDGRRGGHTQAWERTKAWLQTLMPNVKKLETWIDAMLKSGNIMSIGFEGSNLKNVRAKIYWRLKEPVLLDSLGCDILKDQEFKHFLNGMAEDKSLDLSGLVFSLGFHIASQQFFDVKIDMCGCKGCLNYSAGQWLEKINHFTNTYKLADFPIDYNLLEDTAAVSYFGFGLDIRGEKRLNLYLKSHG